MSIAVSVSVSGLARALAYVDPVTRAEYERMLSVMDASGLAVDHDAAAAVFDVYERNRRELDIARRDIGHWTGRWTAEHIMWANELDLHWHRKLHGDVEGVQAHTERMEKHFEASFFDAMRAAHPECAEIVSFLHRSHQRLALVVRGYPPAHVPELVQLISEVSSGWFRDEDVRDALKRYESALESIRVRRKSQLARVRTVYGESIKDGDVERLARFTQRRHLVAAEIRTTTRAAAGEIQRLLPGELRGIWDKRVHEKMYPKLRTYS